MKKKTFKKSKIKIKCKNDNKINGCGGTVGNIASSQLQGPRCDFELELQSVWSDPGSSHMAWVSPIKHAGR